MQMKVSDAVQNIVRMTLPRFSPENQVLWINIDARLSLYRDSGKEKKESRDIHLLFHRPGNYTKVFWHVVENGFTHLHEIPKDGWELKCDHDSCWTSDGLDSPLFKIRCEMMDAFKEKDRKEVSWHVGFSVFSGIKIFEAGLSKVESRDLFERRYLISLGKEVRSIGI
jgi:hypothetical protein